MTNQPKQLGIVIKCIYCNDFAMFKCKNCLKLYCKVHLKYCCSEFSMRKIIFEVSIVDLRSLEYVKKEVRKEFGIVVESHDGNCITTIFLAYRDEFLVSGGDDWSVRLWDFPSMVQKKLLFHHDAPVMCLCISKNNQTLLSGSCDFDLKLYQFNEKKFEVTLKGHKGEVNSINFIKNDEFCVSGSADKSWRIWNLITQTQEFVVKQKFFTKFLSVFNNDQYLITCGNIGGLVVWDLNTKEILFELGQSLHPEDQICCISQSCNYLATGMQSGLITVWDLNLWTVHSNFREHKTSIQALVITRHRDFLFSSDNTGEILKWDLTLKSPFQVFIKGPEVFSCLALDSASYYLITGDWTKEIQLWDIENKNLIKTSKGHKSFVYLIYICENLTTLISVDDENLLAYWDLKSFELKNSLKIKGKIKYLTYSPKQQSVAYISTENKVFLWSTSNSNLISILPISGYPSKLTFSKTHKYIVIHLRSNKSEILQICLVPP